VKRGNEGGEKKHKMFAKQVFDAFNGKSVCDLSPRHQKREVEKED
jgi:hypothetical protein